MRKSSSRAVLVQIKKFALAVGFVSVRVEGVALASPSVFAER